MDRENMTPDSTTIADKKMPFTPQNRMVTQEGRDNTSFEEDYEEWKEGYLAEIYLAENRKEQF